MDVAWDGSPAGGVWRWRRAAVDGGDGLRGDGRWGCAPSVIRDGGLQRTEGGHKRWGRSLADATVPPPHAQVSRVSSAASWALWVREARCDGLFT